MSDQITETAFDLRVHADAEALPDVIEAIEHTLEMLRMGGGVFEYRYLADEDLLEGLEGNLNGA